MRNISWFVIVLILFIGLPCQSARADVAADAPWTIGYAEADITPEPRQVQMTGYGRERYAEGALAPLMSQALALRDSEGNTGILIAADILDFDHVMVEALRRAIARKHGIAPENIMLSASHTHWGPAVRFRVSYSIGAPNVWYMGQMEDKILSCVDEALQNLSPATLEYGSIDFRGIGCNRRLLKNGQVVFGPNPEGSFDGHTPILRVKRGRSPRQLILVGHACHPTSSGKIEKWSPGYPGATRDRLTARLPDTAALFVQGCGGDAKVVHKNPETGKLVFTDDPERAKAAGEKLAEAVLEYQDKGRMVALPGRLACSLATGEISYGERWPREEIERQAYEGGKDSWMTWAARQSLALPDQSESFRYDAQVWKLGDRLTVFAMEGEVCSPWGPRLRSMAGVGEAMVVGYANATGSYIPDKRIVREGGYESQASQQAYFLPAPFTEKIDSEIEQIVSRALDAFR